MRSRKVSFVENYIGVRIHSRVVDDERCFLRCCRCRVEQEPSNDRGGIS